MVRSPPSRASRIVKKLLPHAPGTKRLTERFGNALVCVRYRIDEQTRKRYTTVELVVAESALPAPQPTEVFIPIAYEEYDLQRMVKNAGGKWCRDRQLWRIPRAAAQTLGLLNRLKPPTRNPA